MCQLGKLGAASLEEEVVVVLARGSNSCAVYPGGSHEREREEWIGTRGCRWLRSSFKLHIKRESTKLLHTAFSPSKPFPPVPLPVAGDGSDASAMDGGHGQRKLLSPAILASAVVPHQLQMQLHQHPARSEIADPFTLYLGVCAPPFPNPSPYASASATSNLGICGFVAAG